MQTTRFDAARRYDAPKHFDMRSLRLHEMLAVLAATAALAAALPAAAHHSFAAYEPSKTLTLSGTVKTFLWNNPHVTLGVLVHAEGGAETQEWNIVTSGPSVLTQFGWNENSIRPGERISIVCNPLSDGSPGGRLHTVVKLDTGETLKTKLSAPEIDKPDR
jgi:Family of unknown function (DUF6152)